MTVEFSKGKTITVLPHRHFMQKHQWWLGLFTFSPEVCAVLIRTETHSDDMNTKI